ncbi:hypothetical protein Q7P37_010427 [Cladosporium fusiforme]
MLGIRSTTLERSAAVLTEESLTEALVCTDLLTFGVVITATQCHKEENSPMLPADLADIEKASVMVQGRAALKSEVSRLNARNGSLLELYWQLKHGSSTDAWNLVEQIRSEQLVPEISTPPESKHRTTEPTPSNANGGSCASRGTARKRKSTSDVTYTLATSSSEGSASVSPTVSTSEYLPTSPVPSEAARDVATSHPPLSRRSSFSLSSIREEYVRDHEARLLRSLRANADKIRVSFAIQRMRISEIFYCHNCEDFERLLSSLYDPENGSCSRSVLCEICAAAATCGLYDLDTFASGLLDYWYDSARLLLDDSIEESLVSAIRVSAMLGLYNLLNKATVAIAYFDFGLSLVARYLSDRQKTKVTTWEKEYLAVLRTQKSFIFYNGWLQATLGYVASPRENVELTPEIVSSRTNEHDLVHGIIASIAVLKAATMLSIQRIRNQLREWYDSLPVEAQLMQLGINDHVPLKTSIYYVHLLHLGTVMLIFRYCVASVRDQADRTGLTDEQKVVVDETLSDGLLAAQHSARIISLMREASQSVRHCWMTIYQAYVSGLILIYDATQLKATGALEDQWNPSLDLAVKMIDVLEFCKALDPVARSFVESLTAHCKAFQNIPVTRQNLAEQTAESDFATSSPYEYLFVVQIGHDEQHQALQELFEQVSQPYANSDPLTAQQWNEAGPASPSVSTSKRRQTSLQSHPPAIFGSSDSQVPTDPFISNNEDEYFIGSSEPSWWRAKRSSIDYSNGATTLKIA